MEWFLTKKLYVFSHIDLHTLVVPGPHVKVWIKGSAPVLHDIKSSSKYYLRELGIFNEKYESKLVVQEKS